MILCKCLGVCSDFGGGLKKVILLYEIGGYVGGELYEVVEKVLFL